MGVACSKLHKCMEPKERKPQWIIQMENMGPDELLAFVMEDTEAYEACEKNFTLREACIAAAVRRYNNEKCFYEEVYNRTAGYMVMLDRLLKIRDEIEQEKLRKRRYEDFPLCFLARRDREGDAGLNGSEN